MDTGVDDGVAPDEVGEECVGLELGGPRDRVDVVKALQARRDATVDCEDGTADDGGDRKDVEDGNGCCVDARGVARAALGEEAVRPRHHDALVVAAQAVHVAGVAAVEREDERKHLHAVAAPARTH